MMGLDTSQLDELARITCGASSLREATGALRRAFPGLHVSTVDAFDMKGEIPALHAGDRDLFLMQSDGHCWSVTQDPLSASAVILTQKTA